MTDLSPTVEQKIRASFAQQSMMATLGAELAEIAPGRVVIEAPILPGARQQHGFGHAALSFALGDTAAGYSALSLMGEDDEVLTAEIKTNLLAPARGERLRAVGHVVKPGRRLVVATAQVFALADGTETLVALLQGTMVPIRAE